MSAEEIIVHTPSRLHFGLLSFGSVRSRKYGGAGAMIRRPGLSIRLSPAAQLTACGPLAGRAAEFARRFGAARLGGGEPACRIEVLRAPAEHVGLGVGTQLGMAVAAAMAEMYRLSPLSPAELAASVGRGRRSAIGVYGFCLGGLLVEPGKHEQDQLSPLLARIELPEAWRFVLVEPQAAAGLSGPAEEDAFERLPAVPVQVTERLCRELLLGLMPAAIEHRFQAFSESLYEYGRVAGECFAPEQGGPYASPQLAELIRLMRSLGVAGVGQSSWGPTLYAALPDSAAAERFARELTQRAPIELVATIAEPANQPATVLRGGVAASGCRLDE